MNLVIKEYKLYREEEILPLYESVGWTIYCERPEMLKQAYAASYCTLGAYLDGKLVGILRAVGDGASVLLVQDLLIYPEYQHKGIGTKLMQEMLRRSEGVYQFHLLTDNSPKTVQFYRSVGLSEADVLGIKTFTRM